MQRKIATQTAQIVGSSGNRERAQTLRDHSPCTTADVTDGAVVYLAGNALRGAFLSADEPEGLDAPFAVDAWFVGQVKENLKDWFAHSRFTHRPLPRAWACDAAPAESAE
jgi:hypothetical protein